jgi:hypothetical protein
MSDALLTRIAEGIDALRADIKKLGGASAGAATPPKATMGGAAPDAAAKAAAKKAADEKKAAEAKAAADKSKAGPAANTKAPGGKHTIEQVREMIRKVAADANLGKQTAKDILADDGGVEKVADLKPENFDKVYEACEVALKAEGGGAPAADDDDLM